MSVLQDANPLGEQLIKFLNAIHGDNSYELRFLPEGGGSGSAISFVRKGDEFYTDTHKGKKRLWGKISPQTMYDATIGTLHSQGHGGWFFTVNSPNFETMDTCFVSNKHVRDGGTIIAQTVDIDAPREIRRNEQALKQWKTDKFQKITNHPLKPSILTESKYGYHGYWRLENGEHQYFRQIQSQLVKEFDGDPACINESRVLRLPWFPHMKDLRNQFPIAVKVWHPERKYSQLVIKNMLPDADEQTLKLVTKSYERIKPTTEMTDSRKQRILTAIEAHMDFVSRTEEKVIAHCCMPNHTDNNPSAWIDSEYMWFHCSGCSTSYAIDELAELLEWQDVIDEINRYDIDLTAELNRIRETMVSVSDMPELIINPTEQDMVIDITKNVVAQLEVYGQKVTHKHRKYIEDIVVVLAKGTKEGRTFVAPLDMGGGKSTIIQVFLTEVLNYYQHFGAIVAVGRAKEAQQLAETINYAVGEPVSYAMYGFDESECLANTRQQAGFKYCVEKTASRHKCPFKATCRYYQQSKEHRNYPILVMTHKRLANDLQSLSDKYGVYDDSTLTSRRRTLLIVDEKPLISRVLELEHWAFDRDASHISEVIAKSENPRIMEEWAKAVSEIKRMFIPGDGREQVPPVSGDFSFSSEFWNVLRPRIHYSQSSYSVPEKVEALLRKGGHKETTKKGSERKRIVRLFTNIYADYSYVEGFNTMIFDGTADIDPDYVHIDYQTLTFEPLRSYEGLVVYACNSISGSKTSLSALQKINALCDDIRMIAQEHPTENIFLPVFKDHEPQFQALLQDLIDQGQVLLAHYGETRGSNRFKDCSIIVIGGILHKGESHYIEKTKAVYEQRDTKQDDLRAGRIGKVRRFNDPTIEMVKVQDMLVDYSQEIKRTSQRDNTTNVEGKVYIFHTDDLLLNNIRTKFPGCKVEEWTPRNLIESKVKGKSNNANQQAVLAFIHEQLEEGVTEIWYKDIGQAIERDTKAVSKLMRSETMKQIITGLGFNDKKDGRQMKLIKVK